MAINFKINKENRILPYVKDVDDISLQRFATLYSIILNCLLDSRHNKSVTFNIIQIPVHYANIRLVVPGKSFITIFMAPFQLWSRETETLNYDSTLLDSNRMFFSNV
ncbi:hypothetical protein DERP_002871 [Dermatophagoides pteronyssinus]|uniref:Uncharacterized protein n=1 Tax=Dermatophagoides pteronyssinus TaxID=6956 RepID=A0ABQ8JVW8_DERPT|nr:hypothetical protein DERP_002871 [Dermatophagoides pteronyssinus]